ncbi:putative phage tail protein [Enterococcus timonensis]|uniref:putative phage tail protein n=1 Tax=Enterococcus timonensis TaxID=1852364 RepID=UPI0008D971CF|nr:putative phage tail protein [Enterococcus timonensis]
MIEAQDLKKMLPNWYENIFETKLLMEIEQELFDELALQIKQTQSNQYVSTADSETLAVYENMLRIVRQSGDTLEMRRFRILSRLSTQKPYTKRYLEEVLLSFGSSVTITSIFDEYRVIIESYFEHQGQMSDLDYMIRTIIPANLVADVNNHLALGDLIEQIFLGAALSAGEFVTITQDFKQTSQTGQSVLAGTGVTAGHFNGVTADFKANTAATQSQKIAVASTLLAQSDLTHDYQAALATKQKAIQSAGAVSADFITLD